MPLTRVKAAITNRLKGKSTESSIPHRLLGVVMFADGTYHFWSKKQFHQVGKKYSDEFPGLLKKGFGFEGRHEDRCQNHNDKKNAFQLDNEDWHPRVADWKHYGRFKDGLDETFNYDECEIFIAEASPFRDKIK